MDRDKFRSQMQRQEFTAPLSNEDRIRICNQHLENQGHSLAYAVIIEELAELQQEVTKCMRGKGDRYGLLEEMADVKNCLQWLQTMYFIFDEELNKAVDVKLLRYENNERPVYVDD